MPTPPKTSARKAAEILEVETLSQRQVKKRYSKAKANNTKMRHQLWPQIKDDDLWLRANPDVKGYTTIPRTMPLFMGIINEASKRVSNGKSIPAGKAYLVLWGRVFDEGFLKIESEATAAQEAGYLGERNVSTWREHMRVLRELGFVDYKEGPAGPAQYVLILNPYTTVKKLKKKGWINEVTYRSLYSRTLEIGADELDEK